MDRAKSILAKLLLHFPPHSRWVVFSSQSQYFAAFLINFSINLAMNFNHRTRQGEPGIVACLGNTKATALCITHRGRWPQEPTWAPAQPQGWEQTGRLRVTLRGHRAADPRLPSPKWHGFPSVPATGQLRPARSQPPAHTAAIPAAPPTRQPKGTFCNQDF